MNTVGVKLEVTLFHDDDILWFVNANETQHKFSIAGPKGSPQTTQYYNSTFSCAGDHIIKNDCYTTGVYATNPLEALPPLYTYDTKSNSEFNFQIEPE